KSNFSKAPRPVMIHRYRRADDYVVIKATTADNRKSAADHVEQAKKENQQGFIVRGRRRYAAERE
ncbi:MAG: mitomycin antibiotic biosynthesis protein, partial [Tepidisphaeraceae bacterium]